MGKKKITEETKIDDELNTLWDNIFDRVMEIVNEKDEMILKLNDEVGRLGTENDKLRIDIQNIKSMIAKLE